MPEDDKPKKSRIAAFMHNRVDELDYVPYEEEQKKVTVRLPASMIDDLDELAGKLVMTRTLCAESLLSIAVNEAHTLLYTDPLFANRTSGIPADKIAAIEEHEQLREQVHQLTEAA